VTPKKINRYLKGYENALYPRLVHHVHVDNPDDEGADTSADTGHSGTDGGSGGCFILSLI
jgi:hypothetical protein